MKFSAFLANYQCKIKGSGSVTSAHRTSVSGKSLKDFILVLCQTYGKPGAGLIINLFLEQLQEILANIIYGNSHLHVVHKPIFHSCLVNSNIDYILDIFSGNRNIFITYEELIETYRKAFDYFFYLKIRAAVPNS